MAIQWTTELFKNAFYEKYPDGQYELLNFVYKNMREQVRFRCKDHGEFSIKCESLLRKKYICPMCAEAMKKDDYAKRRIARENTLKQKYGVTNSMFLDSSKEKLKATNLERYGVENPRQNEDVINKARQTNLKRYGAISYAKSEKGLQTIQNTMKERYGADNFMKSDAHLAKTRDMVNKSRETSLERYGTPHYLQSEDAKRHAEDRKTKEYQTKAKFGTFNTSEAENIFYDRLVCKFGADDIKKQYRSDVYPFLCDFYVVSRDLYIELNLMWTHGKHWFESERDQYVLNQWQLKAAKTKSSDTSNYYQNAINNWTISDVAKRKTACENNLNYVVFWDSRLWDVDLWFAMDCPDGSDWREEYSWLPKRDLYFDADIPEKWTTLKLSRLIKSAHFPVFYEKELQMWRQNILVRDMPVQAYLYINRFHYIKKLPNELSCLDILQGFRISGILHGNIRYDVSLMQKIFDHYPDIASVYDPFAGWGERLICSVLCHKYYLGCDINDRLDAGYDVLLEELQPDNGSYIQVGDARIMRVPYTIDVVIACPPYYQTEIYSDQGIENNLYAEFLKNWQDVVKICSHVKYFCFQINQRYKQDMRMIVEDCGFEYVESYVYDIVKASHFHRKDGQVTKKEYEEMLIFKKKGV